MLIGRATLPLAYGTCGRDALDALRTRSLSHCKPVFHSQINFRAYKYCYSIDLRAEDGSFAYASLPASTGRPRTGAVSGLATDVALCPQYGANMHAIDQSSIVHYSTFRLDMVDDVS